MRWRRVEVSRGALLLWAWLFYSDRDGFFSLCLLACALHEMGHVFVLHILDIPIKRLRITVNGAQIICGRTMTNGEELLAAAAGPLVNLLLSFACIGREAAWSFAGLNFLLGGLNLLPVGQLDGGRILRCLLSFVVEQGSVYRVLWCLDFSFTAILLVLGMTAVCLFGNPSLLAAAIWLGGRFICEKRFGK